MIVCIVSHQHIDLVCQGHRHDDDYDDVDDDYNGHDDDSHNDNYDDKGNRSELRS